MCVRSLTGRTLAMLACSVVSACSAEGGDAPQVSRVSEAITLQAPPVSVSPLSISYDFAEVSYLPAGVAAGRDVIFIGDPLESRVIAYSRWTGREIGELPQPPGGFVIPFIMHTTG